MTHNIMAFLNLPGNSEWIIILIIAVLIFGRRLPEIARGLGKSITEFKKGVKETENDINGALEDSDKSAEGQIEAEKTEKNSNTD